MAGTGRPPTAESIFPLPGKTKKIFPDLYGWEPDTKPLTSDVIQKGIVSLPAVKNEQATCGGPNMMVPLLKHWTALPAISYFLTNAMHMRESSRRINSPSTFKPPPRVTLTDIKREAWLQELANPATSLRKLGRTIPHGIYNSVLLDHALSKNIPVPRTIWLIRCVGANEVRALKRKLSQAAAGAQHGPAAPAQLGTPSSSSSSTSPGTVQESENRAVESTWLSEWTEEVLGYLERTIDSFDELNTDVWKTRISYLIELTSHLYYEGLVDRKAVLLWTINCIQSAKSEWLPVSLLFVDIFWDALTQRPYVTLFIRAMSVHYATVYARDTPAAARPLDCTLLRLFQGFPDAFIVPRIWKLIENVLESISNNVFEENQMPAHLSENLSANLIQIKKRNAMFIALPANSVPPQWKNAVQIGIILRDFKEPYDYVALCNDLRAADTPMADLLSTILQWVLESHSTSSAYMGVAIFRYFQNSGVNVEDEFVSFLLSQKTPPDHVLIDLVTEFFKYHLVSLDAYFRRLISSGVLYFSGPKQDAQLAILRNLPFRLLPRHLQSQARILLKDPNIFSSARVQPIILEYEQTFDNDQLPVHIELPGDLLKNEEALLAEAVYNRYYDIFFDTKFNITARQFSVVVGYLEAVRDMYALYKVIGLTLKHTTSKDIFLGAMKHFFTRIVFFTAMGTLEPVAKCIYSRLSEFQINYPISDETKRMARIVYTHSRNGWLRSVVERRMNGIAVPQQMSPESSDEGLGYAVDSESFADLVKASLEKRNVTKLYKIRMLEMDRIETYDKIVMDWIQNHKSDMEMVLKLLAYHCISLKSVDISLQDNDFFLNVMFMDADNLGLDVPELHALAAIRRLYLLTLSNKRTLEALAASTDLDQVTTAMKYIMNNSYLNPDDFVDCIVLPIVSEKSPVTLSALIEITGLALDMDLRLGTVKDRFEHILKKCNPFNLKMCQASTLIIFMDLPNDEVITAVMATLVTGAVRCPCWTSIFNFLDGSLKNDIFRAVSSEFLKGCVPHPEIELISSVLDGLASGSACGDPYEWLVDVVKYTDLLFNAVSRGDFTPESLQTTASLLIKLIVEWTCRKASKPLDTTAFEDLPSDIIQKLKSTLYALKEVPIIYESSDLYILFSDALRMLSQGDEKEGDIPSVRPAPMEGLMMYSRSQDTYTALDTWPFDLIEDANNGQGINDLALDLARFETYVEITDPS